MAKKEKKKVVKRLTEEQRDIENKRNMMFFSLVVGIVIAYFGGYIGSVMVYNRLTIVDAAMKCIEYLQEDFWYPEYNMYAFTGNVIGILLIVPLYLYNLMDYQSKKSYRSDEVAGTGGFMSKQDLINWKIDYTDPMPEDLDEAYPNLILAEGFERSINDRKTRLNNNILIIGGAGTGKSWGYIRPNILQMHASYLITDPSGEMIHSLGTALQNHGYRIKIFNISDMEHSNTYNPLHYIRDEAGVSMLIDCLIKNTEGKEGSGGDNKFFKDAERLLYSACIFYLLDFGTDATVKNFSGVLNMINLSSINENDADANESDLDKIFNGIPKDSLAWKYYKSFKQAAGRTLKSIVISCVTRLQPFMVPQIINLTSSDSLELEKMGDEKTALFIITPQADRTYSFLSSMLYSQAFETWYHKGEQQKANGGSERMKIPIRCMMDEFANIGEIPEFPSKLSTMRKYNISATVVLQDKSQIEAMYKDNWREMVGNCDNVIFLGSLELDTRKYISEILGNKTITVRSRGRSSGSKQGSNQNYQQQKREVMTAEELGRLDPNECVVITRTQRPVLAHKYNLAKHPRFKEAALNEREEELAFLYRNMSVYNNNKTYNKSLLTAQNESIRIKKENIVTDPIRIKDIPAVTNPEDELNAIMLANRKKAGSIFLEKMIECTDILNAEKEGPIKIGLCKHTETSKLSQIVNNIYNSNPSQPIMLFTNIFENSDMGQIIGYAAGLQDEVLRKALINDFVLESKEENNMYRITIVHKNLINYKKAVIEAAS